LDSALKVYDSSDPEKKFKERRSFIRMHLPTLSAHEVQKCVEILNEALSVLKDEMGKCQEAILQLSQGTDPQNVRREFGVSWSLSTRLNEVIDCFKNEISRRKQTVQWIRRERAIYLWEARVRKIGSLQLPLVQLRLDALNKDASEIIFTLKSHLEEIDQLCDSYQRVACETGNLQAKVRKLSLGNPQSISYIPEVPALMKEINQKYLQELNKTCLGPS